MSVPYKTIMTAATLAAAAHGVAFAAQAYPTRPIRIVVAYTPAGATDILARVIGQKMNEAWGQPVVIENRPGANGNIGTEYAAKAAPDGHTFLMTTPGPHGINPSLYRKLGYDAVKDFTAVSLVALVPNVLVVNNALPVKSVKELLAYAKANPGKLNYGSAGNGSVLHLAGELMVSETGIDMKHVPYRGTGPLITDLMGGQVQLAFVSISQVAPQIKAGTLRALAVSTPARSA